MKVSVIIPVYNEEKVIGKCLDSLSKQTYSDLEVIVVDDGSSDRTLNVLRNFQFPIFNFQILRQKHKGAGAARNLGAKYANGDILVFVDADMTFDPDFIEELVEPIIRGETIGTFSKEEYLSNKNNVWARCWNINRGLPADRMHPDNFPDSHKVFRAILKSEFDKPGGFDEKAGYTDDWSLSQKLGRKAVDAPGAVFFHANPDSLKEVFIQSKWMSKRKYKLGIVGYLYALFRVSFPISVLVGIFKALRFCIPTFLIFKVVSDFGQFIGVLEFCFGKASR